MKVPKNGIILLKNAIDFMGTTVLAVSRGLSYGTCGDKPRQTHHAKI